MEQNQALFWLSFILSYCVFLSSANPAIVLVKPWQSEEKKAETETSLLTIQRTPPAPRMEALVPQGPMDEVHSELLALIR